MTSTLVYQHMSSHYRRILNAKPTVDSSPPQTFKPRVNRTAKPPLRPSSSNVSGSLCSSQDSFYGISQEKQLIDKIVACEKFSPAVVCGMEWTSSRRNRPLSEKNNRQMSNTVNNTSHSRHPPNRGNPRPRVPADVLERHKEQFEALGNQFWPRILKSDAESKLRHMRVYHPPKRKAPFSKAEWENSKSENEEHHCKCRGVCTCSQVGNQPDGKEPSQASSRDSAYNGGTSSTPESRSPTPCQRKQRGTNTEENRRQCINHIGTQTDSTGSWKSSEQSRLQKRRGSVDDMAYTKLIHDITQEVVENGQCSDKSVVRIIARHVIANISILNKERMMKEVSKLKKQLGILISDDDLEDDSYSDRLQLKTDVKGDEIMTETSESESWTTVYSQLEKHRARTPVPLEESNIMANLVSQDLNSTIVINKAEAMALNTRWREEEEKDSDSSKEPTVKENLLSEMQRDERDSSEISSDIDSADESYQASE